MSQNLRTGEKLTSEWYLRDEYVVNNGEGLVVTVRSWSADYRTRDGFDHQDGAWKVNATTQHGKAYQRRQTFYGEVAHHRAQRLFDDIINDVRYGR